MPPEPSQGAIRNVAGMNFAGWRSAGRRTTGGLGCRPAANWRTRAALRSMLGEHAGRP